MGMVKSEAQKAAEARYKAKLKEVRFWVTADEKAQLVKEAETAGMSLAAYLRSKVL